MNTKGVIRFTMVCLLVLVSLPIRPVVRAAEVIYTVVSTLNSGVGTLRWAINQANTHTDPADSVRIEFNLPVIDPNYDDISEVWTITPTEVLPLLTGGNITIDAYTQEGAALPTEFHSPTLKVVIDGSALPDNFLSIGLGIVSSNNVIRGLVIQNFPSNGIAIGFPSIEVTNNVISGNCIGTDYECAHDEGNQGDGVYIGGGAKNNIIGGDSPEENNYILFNNLDGIGIYGSNTSDNRISGNSVMLNKTHGIRIYGGSQRNTVGGTTDSERNVISGNTKDGIRIQGSGTNGNVIAGNYIGTSTLGYTAFANHENGVQITEGAQENTIGGAAAGVMNLISGNLDSGVLISGTNTMSNTILGNNIGTIVDASAELSNQYGVQITAGAQYNQVGGDTENERNIISGNEDWGVYLTGSEVSFNIVTGNYIGTDASGTVAVGNHAEGILISDGASQNRIGGDAPGERNVISGNVDDGIRMDDVGTTHNLIRGNYIGTDRSGTVALANGDVGIHIWLGASNNTIGGDTAGQGNLISGNDGLGVHINGADTSGNVISGNFIGTDITGTEVISNTSSGVLINGDAHDNLIGGTSAVERNLISGNGGNGIGVEADAADNVISGNYIGTDVSGTAALGNQSSGVLISNAQNNTIGGVELGMSNLISGNNYSGVRISGDSATGNMVIGNMIGIDKHGVSALPNSTGISIRSGASDNTIGGTTPEERNVISGNESEGIYIYGEGTSGNVISGNFIGTDSSGMMALGNQGEGVLIQYGPRDNIIGGATEAERNIISGNDGRGVSIVSEISQGNVILNNYIGVALDGTKPLGNDRAGVSIRDATGNTVGPGNILAYNHLDGVWVRGETARGNVITQNSIFRNSYLGIYLEEGTHANIPIPMILTASRSGDVSGTACANCTVELFWSQNGEGQGEVYLGSATATGTGDFNLTVSYPDAYNLTATATDERGTSEFSEVFNQLYLSYLPITMNGD